MSWRPLVARRAPARRWPFAWRGSPGRAEGVLAEQGGDRIARLGAARGGFGELLRQLLDPDVQRHLVAAQAHPAHDVAHHRDEAPACVLDLETEVFERQLDAPDLLGVAEA